MHLKKQCITIRIFSLLEKRLKYSNLLSYHFIIETIFTFTSGLSRIQTPMDENFITTVDHHEIRKWVVENKGRPQIDNFSSGESGQKMLRIDFPGAADDTFLGDSDKPHDTSWDAFFAEFEAQNLAFQYVRKVTTNDPSMAYRFCPRE